MKHLVLTAALIAAIAGAVGFCCFRAGGDGEVATALARNDAMAWLRSDFQLTEAQFAAIKQLHDSYSVVCEGHCRDIQEAARVRNDLKAKANVEAGALAEADRRLQELRLVCESAITTHVRRCAAEMSPEAGRRYLALVLPKIKDFDHMAAPDLLLNQQHQH
jgi:hypothetical protein